MNKIEWKDITLRQFLKIADIDKSLSDEEQMFQLAEIVYGPEINELQLSAYAQYLKRLDGLKKEIPDTELKKHYVLNGRKYDCECNITKMTTAQFMDYTEFAKQQDVQKMLAVFMIPKGHKYNDGYDMQEVFDDILEMDIASVNGLSFFIKLQCQTFLNLTQFYLKKQTLQTKKLTKQQKQEMLSLMDKTSSLSSEYWDMFQNLSK